MTTASAPRLILSRLNGWPVRSPADASPPASRPTTHGSGPMWFAIPSCSGLAPPTPRWPPGALSPELQGTREGARAFLYTTARGRFSMTDGLATDTIEHEAAGI